MLTDLDQPDALAQLRAEIEALRLQHNTPGLAVGLVRSAGAPLVAASGSTARSGGHAVGPHTIFSLQSVSKMYTATATMVAVRERLVELDVPITEYLPDFAVRSIFEEHPERRITLRHLLSHTAGFTHEAPVGNNYDIANGSFPERVASIPDSWLRFPVGERYEYSNLGIDLAGWILAVRSGLPFEAYVQKGLLGPLGLTRTTFDLAAVAADGDRAVGHTAGYSELPVVHPLVPCGGAFTSVLDACRFIQFHLNQCTPLLSAGLTADLYRVPFPVTGQTSGYALGTVNILAEGRLLRGHSGRGFGYLCDLYWLPDEGLGVVVLTNSTDHSLQGHFASALLGRLVGGGADTVPLPSTPTRWPDTALRIGLEGEYVGRDSVLLVSSTGKGLDMRMDEDAPIPLEFCGQDATGFSACAGGRVFRLATNGRRLRVVMGSDGSVWSWNHGPNEQPDPSAPSPGARTFIVRQLGIAVARPRLWTANGVTWFGPWSGAHALRLTEHQPGLFFSSTGEALDLSQSPPTYANIPLHEEEISKTEK